MTESDISRLEALLKEYSSQTRIQITDSKRSTDMRLDEISKSVEHLQTIALDEEARLSSIESWRAREAADTVNLYAQGKEQMHILETLSQNEAQRRGFYAAIKFIGIVGVPVLGVLAGAIIWLVQHAK